MLFRFLYVSLLVGLVSSCVSTIEKQFRTDPEDLNISLTEMGYANGDGKYNLLVMSSDSAFSLAELFGYFQAYTHLVAEQGEPSANTRAFNLVGKLDPDLAENPSYSTALYTLFKVTNLNGDQSTSIQIGDGQYYNSSGYASVVNWNTDKKLLQLNYLGHHLRAFCNESGYECSFQLGRKGHPLPSND